LLKFKTIHEWDSQPFSVVRPQLRVFVKSEWLVVRDVRRVIWGWMEHWIR
jgi:hypothetical protein